MSARVGIVAKQGLVAAAPHLVMLAQWLREHGDRPVFEAATATLAGDIGDAPRVSQEEIACASDLLVVLGGDGTLIGLADRSGQAGCLPPILGVNFGRLGFLTEITLREMIPALESALAGVAPLHERAMLRARMLRAGTTATDHVVLNDVVVTRGAISRLIYLSVHVNDQFVTSVKADGLILASPTGSTAYNLAAGGPIVEPGVDALLITPIAPHTLGNRPIVIPGSSTVVVRPAAGTSGNMYVTLDGQIGFAFEPQDELVVTQSDRTIRLVGLPSRSYYDTLREKLHWGER